MKLGTLFGGHRRLDTGTGMGRASEIEACPMVQSCPDDVIGHIVEVSGRLTTPKFLGAFLGGIAI